jgi:hypothetical protein
MLDKEKDVTDAPQENLLIQTEVEIGQQVKN